MDKHDRKPEPFHSQYAHAAETALRATHAAVAALGSLTDLLLGEQKTPDPGLQREHIDRAEALFEDALRWTRLAREAPFEATGGNDDKATPENQDD